MDWAGTVEAAKLEKHKKSNLEKSDDILLDGFI